MSSRLRIPALALSSVSIILCIAIAACAGHSLDVFNRDHTVNEWLLPIWPNHFDNRELGAQIGASIVIALLDIGIIVAVLLSFLPSNAIIFLCSLLGTIAALVTLIFPAVLTNRADGVHMDTLQTWTCGWQNIDVTFGDHPPEIFNSLCHETRFAYFAVIPLFLLQIGLLGLAITALMGHGAGSNASRASKRGSRRLHDGEMGHLEKGVPIAVEMNRVRPTRDSSVDTRSAKSARALVIDTKNV